MTTDYISELDSTAARLNEAMNAFTAEEFTKIPFEGSWSAAQVAEHILKSVSGVPVVLAGNRKPAGRNPEEKVDMLKSVFLDFNSKMKSPAFILPSDEPPPKEDLANALDTSFEKIKEVSGNINLADLFTDFPFPQMEELTGYEWLCFVICHTKRHTFQVRNIYEKVSGKVIVS